MASRILATVNTLATISSLSSSHCIFHSATQTCHILELFASEANSLVYCLYLFIFIHYILLIIYLYNIEFLIIHEYIEYRDTLTAYSFIFILGQQRDNPTAARCQILLQKQSNERAAPCGLEKRLPGFPVQSTRPQCFCMLCCCWKGTREQELFPPVTWLQPGSPIGGAAESFR